MNGGRTSSRSSSRKSSKSSSNAAMAVQNPRAHARNGAEYRIPSDLGSEDDNVADENENDLLKEILLTYRQGSYKAQSKENKPSSQTNSGRNSPSVTSRRSISSNKSTRSNYSTTSNRSRTSHQGSIASVSSRKTRNRDQHSIKTLQDELLPGDIDERRSISSQSRRSFTSVSSNRSTVTHSRKSSSSTIIPLDSRSITSEEGLRDERLRSYLRNGDNISQNNFSDTESVYSVHRSQDDNVSTDGNENRNFTSRPPSFLASSDTTSLRSVPTKPPRKLSTASEARYSRKLKELERRSGSPPSVRRSETDLHQLSKNVSQFQSPLSYHESISEHRAVQRELGGRKLSPSDWQGPRNSAHTSKRGSRKSRSSYASRRSQQDSLSRLTIEEEPYLVENSESGINLHHSVSSLASGQSFYGRGSVQTKSSSGIGSPRSHSRASDGPDNRNDLDDTISIGSASSIMMRVQSRTSHTSMNLNPAMVDPDEEILVGDEKDLHDAARSGDQETVEQLLDLGTDVNCRNEA